jgi:hypothetical protein
VNDLVSRLTTEEIMFQMAKEGGGKYGGPAPAIARLGISPYQRDITCFSVAYWNRASKRYFARRNKTTLGARGQAETSRKIENLRSNKTTGKLS